MIFTGKETPQSRPILKSLFDKVLHRFPKQEVYWDRVMEKYPDWKSQQLGWTEMAEPLSDNTAILLKMIAESVTPDDIILTTAIHAPFFATQTQKVHAFDISPRQLQGCLAEFPNVQSSWFCDVFYPPMLHTVLVKTNPTIVYLSNILDYGTYKQHRQLLQQLHRYPTVQSILCSTKCAWGHTPVEISAYLTHLSAENGWKNEVYKVFNDTDAFFKLTRR